ncbi:MAG: Zn-ribbon domain-containing OB-fold protein [Dehalococcoidia bacterium]|nr:Zn-ribbon domain-containing OB-fold protein [Dehalococcoidia bacterium]
MTIEAKPQLPVPHPTPISQPFWDACLRHELTVQKCTSCGKLIFIPQDFCRYCFTETLEWVPSSGTGKVYSYTTVWRPQTPSFEVPYVVAIIDIDGGYQMLSNVINVPPDQVKVGMAVEVVWDDVTDTITLPKFQPRQA